MRGQRFVMNMDSMLKCFAPDRAGTLALTASLALCGIIACPVPSAHAQAIAGYSEYFIPGDEVLIRDVLEDLDVPTTNALGVSIIGVSAWADDTTLYYDHWEDGYSFDQDNPGSTADEIITLRATTVTNACTPGDGLQNDPNCQTSDAFFTFASFDIPRAGWTNSNAGCDSSETLNYCYDGRDRIFVAGGATTLSRATWVDDAPVTGTDGRGTLQALAWEVYPVRPQLTTYILPFGEDLFSATPGLFDFERVYALVQATQDNTTIQIDFNADGVFDPVDFNGDGDCADAVDANAGNGFQFTLQAGEVKLVDRATDGNGGAQCGADSTLDTATKIVGSATLQAQYIVGDEDSDWELRGFSAFPRGLWDNEYYAPVGSFGSNTDIYLHNPHTSTLTVSYETNAGTGTINVPPTDTVSFQRTTGAFVPDDSAVFLNAPDVFWGVSTIDTSITNSNTGGRLFDWGYALTPSRFLRDEHRLGWAPGRNDFTVGCTDPNPPDFDQSGIFVTAAQSNTTLFVDRTGDGVFDNTFDLNLLESVFIEDIDGDLSNTRLYATGDFVGAWGQNPQNSGVSDCFALDMGYTILPNSDLLDDVVRINKESNPQIVGLDPDGATQFTLTVRAGEFSINGITVVDQLPADLFYVDDSTTITFASGASVSGNSADPTITGSPERLEWALNSYLSGGGDLFENTEVTIQFLATTGPTPAVVEGDTRINETEVCGTRSVGTPPVTQTFCATDFEIVLFSEFQLAIEKDTLAPDPVAPGDTITYEVEVSNPGNFAVTNLTLLDDLPNSVSYVDSSISLVSGVCGSTASGDVGDNFDTNDSYAGNNGTDNWTDGTNPTNWEEELDVGGSAANGVIQVDGGELRFVDIGTNDDNYAVARLWNIAESPTELTISFDYRSENLEIGPDGDGTGFDDLIAEYTTDGTNYTQLARFVGDTTPVAFSTTIPWNLVNGSIRLRFRLDDDIEGDDVIAIDNVAISFTGSTTGPTLNAPPNIIRAEDACTLDDGQSIIFRFDVLVDDPVPAGVDTIINVARATASEIPIPVEDDAQNILVTPSSLTAEVGDLVWIDFNANGIPEVGEPGIPNVVLVLKDEFGTPLQTTTTDSNGLYLFTGVPPDVDYYVEIQSGLPAGLTQVPATGTNDRTPDFDLLTFTNLGNLADDFTTSSYGNANVGSLTWSSDWVENGDTAGAGAGAGEIQVTGGQLSITGDTIADGSGIQRVVDVPAGADNATWTFDFDSAGALEAADVFEVQISNDGGSTFTTLEAISVTATPSGSRSYDISPFLTTTGQTVIRYEVTQFNGSDEFFFIDDVDIAFEQVDPILSFLDADLGYVPQSGSAIIGDRVWSDADADGFQDAGEVGLSGVEVRLYVDSNGDGIIDDINSPAQTTTTVANGNYLFNVPASGTEDYIVFVDPDQAVLTDYQATTQVSFVFADVQDGDVFLTADAGFVADPSVPPFTIRDRIWFDSAPQNGDWDAEPGFGGVTVELLDQSGDVVGTTTTTADGIFEFTGVPGGVRYSWRITDQAGVLDDYFATTPEGIAREFQMDAVLSDTYSDAQGSVVPGGGTGASVLDYTTPATGPHFGYNALRSIGDTVWSDLDGDNTIDPGEPGISGVTVRLYNDVDGDGVIDPEDTLRATQVTDGNGFYLFSGLPFDPVTDTNYIVSIEDQPTNTTFTGAGGPGTDGAPDSDPSTQGQQRSATIPGGGASDLDNDFGYQPNNPEVIAGRIWNDQNADGDDENGAEPGFENVTVALYFDANDNGVLDSGEPIIQTTSTNANGDYMFMGVPGNGTENYVVVVTDTGGSLSGFRKTFEVTEGINNEPYNDLEVVPNLGNTTLYPAPPNSDPGSATNIDFGLTEITVPLPITLASFESASGSGGIVVDWTTATETRNVGFHLYGRSYGDSTWRQLTPALVPSLVVDSLEPQRYREVLAGVSADELLIEDWDTRGTTKRHGPFVVGRSYGVDAVSNGDSIDWIGIREENARTAPPPRLVGQPGVPFIPTRGALLAVTEPGIQRVTFAELQAAGADFFGTPIGSLALTDNETAVVRYVLDANGNGVFDAGDAIEFVGEVQETLYSVTNYYRMSVDPGRAVGPLPEPISASVATPDVYRHTVVAERQRAYSQAAPRNDPWYDERIFAFGAPASVLRAFDLPGYAGGFVSLSVTMWGESDFEGPNDHHLVVYVNGTEVANVRYSGFAEQRIDAVVPASLVASRNNLLTLEVTGDVPYTFDLQTLDRFSVTYDRHTEAFEGRWEGALPNVTQSEPRLVSGFVGEAVAWNGNQRRVGQGSVVIDGAGNWVAADSSGMVSPAVDANFADALPQPRRGIDYLVISHEQFIGTSAMEELLILQEEERGFETQVVDVTSLYATYSDHEVDPNAIQTYISFVAPRFVLLVGADSYDYHDYLGLASQSFVPTYYVQTDDTVTFAPSDSLFADPIGQGFPMYPIGRLPVRTEAELDQLVRKLYTYRTPRSVVVATGPSDTGREFATVGERHTLSLAPVYQAATVLTDDAGLEAATARLLDLANDGGSLLSYVGHSSFGIWGLNPRSGILLDADGARSLTNQVPLLVTQWGCWNTYFVNPSRDTMANGFLFQSSGAAGVMGATALTDLGLLRDLGETFFGLVGGWNTVGETLREALRAHGVDNPESAAALRGFVFLGDPAAELR